MTTFGLLLLVLPVVVVLYAYAGYPLALWIIAANRSRPNAGNSGELPFVSVVVPAFNEETQIAGALEALLAQDFPSGMMHILVVSDASTDGTDSIVEGYRNRGVELLRLSQRSGKTSAENAALDHLRGEIIINTDASIRLHPGAVRALVAHMADPSVGVATGRDMSISRMSSSDNLTEAGYVQYEMRVRALETRAGGIVGASGSLYAIRSKLQRIPVRADLSRDFSAALTAHKHGFRAVSVDEAVCFVPRTGSLRREFSRKTRTISRGMRTLHHERALLDITTHGTFAWKLISHKLCRWAVPVMLIPATLGLLLLAPRHPMAVVALAIGALGVLLAATGAAWPEGRRMPGVVSLAAFGAAANLAVIFALWRVAFTDADAIWEPTRREEKPVSASNAGSAF